MRGDRQRTEVLQDEKEKTTENTDVIVISNFRTKKIPPLVWRECIKKVWEVDPLLCSHCGCLMKIISFIYERKVIIRTLDHLGLLKGAQPKRITGHRRSLLIHVEGDVLSRMMMAGRHMRSPLLTCKHCEIAWNGEVLSRKSMEEVMTF